MDPNQHESAHSGNTLSRPSEGGDPTETQRKIWVEDKAARGVRAAFLILGMLLTAIRVVMHFPGAPVLWLILLALMALPFVIYYFHVRTRLFSSAVGVALLPAIWLLLSPIGFWAILLNFAVVASGAIAQEIALGRLARRGDIPLRGSEPGEPHPAITTPTPTTGPNGEGAPP